MGDEYMMIDSQPSAPGSFGVLLRVLVGIGFLAGLAGATAMAGEAAEEAIPPEFAEKIMPTGIRDDPASHVIGREIYEGRVNPAVNCAWCHGNDGKSTRLGKGAPDLSALTEVSKHSEAYWFWRISEKKSGTTMPGYKDKLTEEQRW